MHRNPRNASPLHVVVQHHVFLEVAVRVGGGVGFRVLDALPVPGAVSITSRLLARRVDVRARPLSELERLALLLGRRHRVSVARGYMRICPKKTQLRVLGFTALSQT